MDTNFFRGVRDACLETHQSGLTDRVMVGIPQSREAVRPFRRASAVAPYQITAARPTVAAAE